MKVIQVKRAYSLLSNLLYHTLKSMSCIQYREFIRNRIFAFESALRCVSGLNSKCLITEMLDFFDCAANTAIPSAFVRQLSKILPNAFEYIFRISLILF